MASERGEGGGRSQTQLQDRLGDQALPTPAALLGNIVVSLLQPQGPAAASPGGGETFLSKNTCFPGPEQTQCLRGGGSSWGCVYRASAGLRSVDTASPGARAGVQRDRPGWVPLLIGVRAAPAPSSESR